MNGFFKCIHIALNEIFYPQSNGQFTHVAHQRDVKKSVVCDSQRKCYHAASNVFTYADISGKDRSVVYWLIVNKDSQVFGPIEEKLPQKASEVSALAPSSVFFNTSLVVTDNGGIQSKPGHVGKKTGAFHSVILKGDFSDVGNYRASFKERFGRFHIICGNIVSVYKIVAGSNGDQSQRDLTCRHVFLEKNAVHHFMNSSVTANDNNVPCSVVNGFYSQTDGMKLVCGKDAFKLKSRFNEKIRYSWPQQGGTSAAGRGIYYDHPRFVVHSLLVKMQNQK